MQHRRLLELAEVDARDLQPLQASVGADEVRDEVRRRSAQHDCGRVVLREQPALGHDRDAVAELHGLLDVVRDEHDRLLHLDLQPQELVLQAVAGDRVDRAERLVHEQHGRVGAERAGDADALLLSAGQLARDSDRGTRTGSRPTRSSSSSTRAFTLAFFQPSSRGTVAMFVPIV